MTAFSWNLLAAAASVALIHTVLGPDHWLPFTMLARARGWGRTKTLIVTFVCGIGHVGSSVLLGVVGLALGYEATHLAGLEASRGDIAAWGLVAFGAAYGLWGVRHAIRKRGGLEPHEHQGEIHIHTHGDHVHVHDHPHLLTPRKLHAHVDPRHLEWKRHQTTFWSLFILFVLGPCEPMIPLFVIPLSRGDWPLAWMTALVFSIVTLIAMLTLVGLASFGMERLPLGKVERWSHAMAGGVIAGCGLAVIFLGL